MRNHNVPLGVAVFLATVAVLGVRYFRVRRPSSFRRFGWAGLAIILVGELALFFGVPWVTTYFTPLMWTGYLLLADAMVGSLTGQSWIGRAPWRFLSLAFWSVPLWLIFEAYNLRLQNWAYVGLPQDWVRRNVGYVWSFATIWPVIFLTADLLQALRLVRSQENRRRALSRASMLTLALVGLAFVSVPLLVPLRIGRYLFGPVWLGFALLLDPLNHRWKGCSLLRGWEEGENVAFWSFLLSGVICGVFWEFWNYWAAAKWLYVFPIWQDWKIFEMPVPGYLGFPAFALECFVMYEFLRSARNRLLAICSPLAPCSGLNGMAADRSPARDTSESSSWPASSTAGVAGARRAEREVQDWCRSPLPGPKERPNSTRIMLVLLIMGFELGMGCQSLAASQQAAQTEENQRAIARHGTQLLMDGDMDEAAQVFRQIEQADPGSPLGYVLEADAYWWKIYLTEANLVDPDVFEALSEAVTPYDTEFRRLDSLAIEKADSQIRAHPDDPWNKVYEGLAYALHARLEALRDHALATARNGKKMRNLSLDAVKLNPNLYDAYLGVGIYNYFEATLPGYVKMLRFLIRLPRGDRALGLQQLQAAADKGEIVVGEAKFHLAKNYSRNNERQYGKALELMQAMQRDYPHNPLWKLLVGSLEIRMGQTQQGEALYREVIKETENPASEVWNPLHLQAQRALDRRHAR